MSKNAHNIVALRHSQLTLMHQFNINIWPKL